VRAAVVVVVIAAAVWAIIVIALVVRGRRSAAAELARLVPNLASLFRGLMTDPRVPRTAKLWLGAAVVWLLSPVDLVPEFIPIAGPLDDAIVAALVLRHVVKRAGPHVVAEHWRGSASTLRLILRAGGVRRADSQPPPTEDRRADGRSGGRL
jgi:uncharacterized membrane protein YkvA (DUF1232 family)